MLLLKLGIFDITFGTVFTFAFGIAIGVAIVTIAYLLFVLKKLNGKEFENSMSVKIENYEISPNLKKKERLEALEKQRLESNSYKAYEMILMYQDIFRDKKIKGNKGDIQYALELSKSLITNIATLYYPESRFPIYEITIDEAIELAKYLSSRITDILNYNGLKMIRKFNINTIISVKDFSFEIKESAFVQKMQNMHVNKILFGCKVLINIVNPIYWVRKLIVNTSFDVVTRKLCLAVIQIVGEESYNVYSKGFLKKENELNEE